MRGRHTGVETLGPSALAKAAQVNLQTVRFYEREGLLVATHRGTGAHKRYAPDAVRVIGFIKRAQRVGFTLNETKALLALRTAGPKGRLAARGAAIAKLDELDSKLRELAAMRAALAALVDTCVCAAEPDKCPILDAFEGTDTKNA